VLGDKAGERVAPALEEGEGVKAGEELSLAAEYPLDLVGDDRAGEVVFIVEVVVEP
jgi:hypothetical protein